MATSKLVLSHNIASVFVLALVGCSGVEQHQQSQQDDTKTTTLSTQSDGEIAAHLESIRSRFKVKPFATIQGSSIPTPPGTAPEEVQQPLSILGKSVATSFVTNTNFLKPEFEGFKKWNGLRTATVKLPVTASGAVELEDDTSKVRVSFALRGAQDSAVRTVDGYAFYQGGFRGADMIHRVHPEGTEDYVVFENKPDVEELVYDVDVSGVAGLRLVSNVLEFMDKGGAPRLRIAPPYGVDSLGERFEAKLAVSGCAYDDNPAAPWGRPVVRAGMGECTVRVSWEGVAYPAVVDPAWTATGSMSHSRAYHTASTLASGAVLVAGGWNNVAPIHATAELYDPMSGTFSSTGNMLVARNQHTANVLNSGNVLIAGGQIYVSGNGMFTSTAEVYNAVLGTFASTGSMASVRVWHTSTNLNNDRVLMTGGYNGTQAIASAELYNGATGTFNGTGALTSARSEHGAAKLSNGKVLIVGGGPTGVTTAELYDPNTGAFSTTGPMNIGRRYPIAVGFGVAKALVAGGESAASGQNFEVYDAVAGIFAAPSPLLSSHYSAPGVVLGIGKILVIGGPGNSISSAEIYDPSTGMFSTAGSMSAPRMGHTANLLGNGKVLVVGGTPNNTSAYTSAELFGLAANGLACTQSYECVSGFCADAVCCNTACNGGSCDRCNLNGSVGTCATAPAGNPGASPACVFPLVCDGTNLSCATCTSAAGCAPGYGCDGGGTCKLNTGQPCPSGASSCLSGYCADGVCCNSACDGGSCDRCDLTGSVGMCTTAPFGNSGVNPVCSTGYQCDGAALTCAPCGSDNGCTSPYYCSSDGTCQPRKSKGTVCNASAGQDCKQADCRVCATGQCVDGFCCDTPCEGNCDVCSAAKGATANGSCTILADSAVGSPSCSPYLCDGISADCPTTCVNNSDCTAVTSYCSNGQCFNGGQNGNTCSSNGECLSNHCVEGYCCNSACTGQCESCVLGVVGTCSPVNGQPVPSKPPCNGDSTVCSGACNGVNTASCTFQLATTECLAASCENGVEQAQQLCNGNGSCVAVPSKSCAPYACNPATDKCHANCAVATDCAPGYFCLGTVCTLASNVATGDSCATNEQCISGYCVDNVCCNLPCTATCMSCDGNFNTDGVGQCSPVAGGKDPRGDCEKDTSTQCAADGYCDGQGACRDATPAGDACGVNVCDGALVARQECDGFGNCAHVTDQNCLEYSCDAASVQCKSTCAVSNDCAPGYTCVGSACQAGSSLSDGEVCTLSEQCISGNCVDGVCCDQPCTDTCQSCDGNANTAGPGKCSSVADGKDPRNDCPQDPNNVCGADGMCDGQGQCRPRAKSGEPCGQPACDGDSVQTKSCDGFGECLTDTESCSPYNCDSGLKTCKTACVTTADCSEGATCSSNGLCTLGEASCSNKTTIKQSDGSLIDCSPFICQAGQCTATCSANSDCASSASCANGQCVDNGGEGGQSGSGGASGASNSAAPKDDGGCGCRVVQSRAYDWEVLGAIGVVVAAIGRRRRNRYS